MSRKNKKQKKKMLVISISVVLFSLVFVLMCTILAEEYIPNKNVVSIQEYNNFNKNDLYIVIDDEYIEMENPPVKKDNELYLPIKFIKNYIDEYIFWDEQVKKLTITTENKVIRMNTDDLTYFVNNKPFSLSLPVYEINDEVYLPVNLLHELYDIKIEELAQTNIILVEDTTKPKLKSKVNGKLISMRHTPSIKSPIVSKLPHDTVVYVYEETDDFIKIRTELGELGFIPAKNLDQSEIIEGLAKKEVPEKTKAPIIEDKIILLWDQVTNVKANRNELRTQPVKSVNVLSPTWFKFDLDTLNGDIINLADKSYVEFAHKNGYQVWALISDIADSYTNEVSHQILSNTETREHVIKQLLAFISMYDLDGINIDLELVRKDDAEVYLQFFREFYPLMKEQGAVLSVDMYVPSEWSMYYNRTEVAKVVDYVCVMAYDEHYAGSENSGPVASLGFVDKGIKDTLKEVPAEKILMGIPVYVRVWREVIDENGVKSHTIKNYDMEYAYELFKDNNAEMIWLDDIGSYYTEYTVTENGQEVTYKTWLEDVKSIQRKLETADENNTAGIAVWKRGLEDPAIWDLIYEYKN